MISEIFSKSINYPKRTAIVFDDCRISYESLFYEVKKISSHIKSRISSNHELNLNKCIGFCMDRSISTIIVMLAIWDCGYCYLPLDKKYPVKRTEHIIKDTGVKIIITNLKNNDENVEILSTLSSVELLINLNSLEIPDMDIDFLQVENPNCLNEIAYIIYTSGTTGLPKGVIIKHTGLVNIIKSAISILNIRPEMNFYVYASIGFDAAGWDIYTSLLSGGSLHIANENLMISSVDTHDYLLKNSINMATVTPAFLADMPLVQIPSLEILVVMGDKPIEKNMEFWCQGRKCYNGYGPTETTIGATIHEYKIGDSPSNIGKPFDGYEIYLFDKNMEIISNIDEMGEIYIGGIGVAMGYLNKPELTREKFIETQYGKLYKTGDFAKLNKDLDFEFVGRIDNQIKINGVRVELEEIEGYVTEIDFVLKASVTYEKSEKRLIVYYVSIDNFTNENEQNRKIKNYLEKKLIKTVLPQHYKRIDNFILTSNGKIDKSQLPVYTISYENIDEPTNEIEMILVNLYSELFHVENIGTNIDYFELGGDSLGTVRVVSKLKEYDINIQNVDVMKYPIIKDLAQYILELQEIGITEITRQTVSTPVPFEIHQIELTVQQSPLWYYQQLYPENVSYNTFIGYIIDGCLNVEKFVQTLDFVFNKHETLRTLFKLKNNHVIQEFENLRISKENIFSEIPENDISDEINKIINQPFKMINSFLFRIKLLKTKEQNKYVFLLVKHNIITDAHSEKIFIEEFTKFYNSDIELTDSDTFKSSNKYLKYLNNFNSINSNKLLEFWNNYLFNFVGLSIPTIPTISTISTISMTPTTLTKTPDSESTKNFSIIKTFKIDNFENFIRESKHSSFKILFAVFYLTIARFNQYNFSENIDITIGTQVSNRTIETQNLMGFMISTIVLRMQFTWNITLENFLNKLSSEFNKIFEHKLISYDTILQIVKTGIDIMFVMQSQDENEFILENLKTQKIEVYKNSDAFPIYVDVYPQKEKNTFKFHIKSSGKYDRSIIEKIFETYEILLNEITIISKIRTPVSLFPYLPDDCHKNILVGENKVHEFRTITSIINHMAILSDQQILHYSTEEYDYLNESINYGQLLFESNKISKYLMEFYKIKKNDIIGVKMRRGKNFVVLLLGILQIGATYVPIDPSYPEDRILYMLNDCNPKILIENNSNRLKMDIEFTISITWEELNRNSNSYHQTIFSENSSVSNVYNSSHLVHSINPIDLADPDTIAYIIYTSGSTGKPKGCSIKHSSIMNTLYYFKDLLKITSNDKIWSLTTISFDIMVLEIFLPLISGAKLLICPQCVVEDPMNLVRWINNHSPTVLQATPTQFNLISKHINSNNNMKIIVGGEALTSKLSKKLFSISSEIYNVYGPSETTIWSTVKKIRNSDEITIGKPIYNTKCIVLNENQQIVPNGSIGELCIGGDGLSVGYFKREELTLTKFIDVYGEKYYKTGDLVKIVDVVDENNNLSLELEYIGRTDFQIKINGRRIEIGEIINTMESSQFVSRAVVVAKKHNDILYLIGYYTGTETPELLEHMKSTLPIWMMPHFVIHILKFPETLNGKIDLNLLPNPFESDMLHKINFLKTVEQIEPSNELQMVIHDIYLEIIQTKIQIEKISIKESIVNLGCDSLTIILIVSKLNNKFNIRINPEDYFKISTIEKCSELIKNMVELQNTSK